MEYMKCATIVIVAHNIVFFCLFFHTFGINAKGTPITCVQFQKVDITNSHAKEKWDFFWLLSWFRRTHTNNVINKFTTNLSLSWANRNCMQQSVNRTATIEKTIRRAKARDRTTLLFIQWVAIQRLMHGSFLMSWNFRQ